MKTLDTVRQALDEAVHDSLLSLIRSARDRAELDAARLIVGRITHAVDVDTALALRETELRARPTAYGYCPACKALGVSRDKLIEMDACANGHWYPSTKALK